MNERHYEEQKRLFRKDTYITLGSYLKLPAAIKSSGPEL